MNGDPLARQWRLEGDRVAAADEAIAEKIASEAELRDAFTVTSEAIPRRETIKTQSSDIYRPPPHLEKTATSDERTRLEALLREMWEINEAFVGERTLEAEAYLVLTGDHEHLVKRIEQWCESYFSRRFQKTNNRDKGDPFRKYERLLGEYDDILAWLSKIPNSLNYLYLDECTRYVQWLVCVWLRTNVVGTPEVGKQPVRLLGRDRPESKCEVVLDALGAFHDHLLMFLCSTLAAVDSAELSKYSAMPAEKLIEMLNSLAGDIQEMRPFLIRNFDPLKTKIIFGNEQHSAIAWDWSINYGMARMLFAAGEPDLIEAQVAPRELFPVRVGLDGILRDGRKPWITAASETRISDVNPLALNVLLLKLFHEKLFSFYDQIDFDRMRRRRSSSADRQSEDLQVLAFSCQELERSVGDAAQATTTADDLPKRRIPALRLQTLCKVLEQKFGCEVNGGKGSEITFYRSRKKYRLGRHKRNPEIHHLIVKQILSRLQIDLDEWLLAVYG
jgi:hypothetical protein